MSFWPEEEAEEKVKKGVTVKRQRQQEHQDIWKTLLCHGENTGCVKER